MYVAKIAHGVHISIVFWNFEYVASYIDLAMIEVWIFEICMNFFRYWTIYDYLILFLKQPNESL